MAFVYDGNADFWVSIGSLDHPEDWPVTREAAWGPVTHGFIDHKVPWHAVADGLPQRSSRNPLLREQAEAALGGEPPGRRGGR